MNHADVVIVGGGIVGLAAAYAAWKDGKTVIVCDRHHKPLGASIRNFGMVWPIGQREGAGLEAAMRSRSIWQELAQAAGFFCEESGSLHLAYREDELAVLTEFVDSQGEARGARMLSADQASIVSPGIRRAGLLGAMHSTTELNVESRTAMPRLWDWFETQESIEIRRGTTVAGVSGGHVRTTDAQDIRGDLVIIAGGHEGVSLYPDLYPASRYKRCKLQMMRTVPQPGGWRMGSHIAGGWTLRHYDAFLGCPSLPELRERVSREQPEFDRYGIHIMLSQHSRGDLVIGDSHVYGDEIDPFDSAEIDTIILEHAKQLVDAPDWSIESRWHGEYLKRTDGNPFLVEQPEDAVLVVNAMGGAGMTLSFGVLDRVYRQWADSAVLTDSTLGISS